MKSLRVRAAYPLLALCMLASWPQASWSQTSPASAASAQGASITFIVEGLRFSGGSVRVDICTPETFLKAECPYSGAALALKGTTMVTVEGVPPGTYAAQIYHDWNDNHRVDRQALGIPKEGLAFSNDAPLGLHGPSFKRAAFVHTDEPQSLTVKLHHFAKPPHE